MIRVGLIATITTLGWNFPLQEVAKPDCRGTERSQLDDACKIDIVAGSQQPTLARLLFSVLRGASYEHNHDATRGGHPGIDLPTSAGTPVYAIGDGEVISAQERNGYGLSITIKHSIEGKTIYSSYSHLSEMLVKKGEKVAGNTMIGKVGCTGTTTSGDPTRCGNHLEFQLTNDKSPSHPYGYGDCAAGYTKAVAEGTCRDKLLAYTINPLEFFATHTNIGLKYPLFSKPATTQPAQEHTSAPPATEKKKTGIKDIFARLKEQNAAIIAATQKTTNTSLATVVTPQKTVQQATPTFDGQKNQALIDLGKLQWSWNSDLTTLTPYKVVTLTLTITDNVGNPYIGKLSEPFRVTIDDASVASFFPEQVDQINTEKKYLFMQTRSIGTTTVTLRYGNTKLAQEVVTVK